MVMNSVSLNTQYCQEVLGTRQHFQPYCITYFKLIHFSEKKRVSKGIQFPETEKESRFQDTVSTKLNTASEVKNITMNLKGRRRHVLQFQNFSFSLTCFMITPLQQESNNSGIQWKQGRDFVTGLCKMSLCFLKKVSSKLNSQFNPVFIFCQ